MPGVPEPVTGLMVLQARRGLVRDRVSTRANSKPNPNPNLSVILTPNPNPSPDPNPNPNPNTMVLQALQGLMYLHREMKQMHRDLKVPLHSIPDPGPRPNPGRD